MFNNNQHNKKKYFLSFWIVQVPEADFWVIPIIQGFVQVEELVVNYNDTSDEERSSPDTPPQEVTCVDDIHPRFTVALISRRSRHRAGRSTVFSTDLREGLCLKKINAHLSVFFFGVTMGVPFRFCLSFWGIICNNNLCTFVCRDAVQTQRSGHWWPCG